MEGDRERGYEKVWVFVGGGVAGTQAEDIHVEARVPVYTGGGDVHVAMPKP